MITTNRLVLLKYTSCHSNTQIKLDLPAEVCIKLSVFYLFHSLMMSCFPLKEDYEKYMRQKLPAEFFFFFFPSLGACGPFLSKHTLTLL